VVRRLGSLARFVVAEINEPDPARSPDMKAAYRTIERALEKPAEAFRRPEADAAGRGRLVARDRSTRPRPRHSSSSRSGSADAASSSRAGTGSIGRALATFLDGFRPDSVVLLDGHEASLTADRRARGGSGRVRHVLADVRDAGRVATKWRGPPRRRLPPRGVQARRLGGALPRGVRRHQPVGSWNVLRGAERAGVDTVVVATTDKAALAASVYGRTKRLVEQLTAFAARDAGASDRRPLRERPGTAGSVSELFLRQARADVPLTVTDTGMMRYWITMAHAATLAAHAALLAAEGARSRRPPIPVSMSVGDLAQRIWRVAGRPGEPRSISSGFAPARR
jgi:hypothetical protein